MLKLLAPHHTFFFLHPDTIISPNDNAKIMFYRIPQVQILSDHLRYFLSISDKYHEIRHYNNKGLKTRLFLVACYATTPRFVGPSVGPSVCPSVRLSVRHTLLFLGFCGFWPHCSCPNDGVTSIIAPAHPHATGVAVYPALFELSPTSQYLSKNTRLRKTPTKKTLAAIKIIGHIQLTFIGRSRSGSVTL